MPKAYYIARITVKDPEAYKAYAEASGISIHKYGGRILARGGRSDALEGAGRPRNVILEFESYEAAQTWYHSPEYQAAIELRRPVSEGETLIVEGIA